MIWQTFEELTLISEFREKKQLAPGGTAPIVRTTQYNALKNVKGLLEKHYEVEGGVSERAQAS